MWPARPSAVAQKRALTAAAGAILRVLSPFVAPVGVFVEMALRRATAIAFQLGLRSIQTYDDSPPNDDSFPFAHLPAFRVKDAASLVAIHAFISQMRERGHTPSAVLIDSFVAGEMGGTGHRAPWELLAGFDPGSCKVTFPNLDKDAWEPK